MQASTHWKKVYDPICDCIALKPKQGYSTYEEANEAAKSHMLRHPDDKYIVSAYKCIYCDKWHIGHTTPDEEKKLSIKGYLFRTRHKSSINTKKTETTKTTIHGKSSTSLKHNLSVNETPLIGINKLFIKTSDSTASNSAGK